MVDGEADSPVALRGRGSSMMRALAQYEGV
jgi:hypothetical protein